MPESVSAAEAPTSATTSGSFSRSWRQHGADDLGLVAETRREQRPDRPVDEPRGQHLLLGGAAFALEEAAGDLAGGEGLFLVVDGEREEILPRLRLLLARLRCTAPWSRHRWPSRRHRPGARPCRSRARGGGRPTSTSLRNTSNMSRLSLLSLGETLRGRRSAREARRRGSWPRIRRIAAARARETARRAWKGQISAAAGPGVDQRLVALGIVALQIIEQAAALADHDQQAAARMEILADGSPDAR